MKPRDFIVEHGASREGPWELFKVVRGVRVGAAAVPAARRCRDTFLHTWVRIRRADRATAWAIWRPR